MGPPEGAARATDAMPGRRTASRVGPIGRGGTLRRGEGRRDRGSVRRPRGRLPGAARDEGAGAGRRESGAASGGARGDVGGAIGSSRAPTRSGFFSPARRSDPRGVASGGGGARSIAARSRSRARAPGRIPPRDDPSDRLDDADERVRGGSGRPRPSRARAPAPGRRSGGPAPRHDPPPSRKRRKKRAGRLGKPSREGSATPRAPPKRESTSRACLRVDRVDGRARVRSATPVLARATDRATIRSQTFSHAERRHVRVAHERQLAHPKTHEQTVSKIGISETFFFLGSRGSLVVLVSTKVHTHLFHRGSRAPRP